MSVSSIVMIVVILLLLYFVIVALTKDVSMLNKTVADGTAAINIASPSTDKSNTAANFTYSIWFYVNDWNYRYGDLKFIFARIGAGGTLSPNVSDAATLDSLLPCPAVTLDPTQNNVSISITCTSSTGKTSDSTLPTQLNVTTVQNVPIQRWVNLLFSVYGRTLDIYIDGKLVRTTILPGIAMVNPSSNIYITPNGGFNGWTSKFQYWPNATDPQTAWNIYTAGYGGGFLDSILGQYQVKFAFINNGVETSSISI
jgi:hypothetical protein